MTDGELGLARRWWGFWARQRSVVVALVVCGLVVTLPRVGEEVTTSAPAASGGVVGPGVGGVAGGLAVGEDGLPAGPGAIGPSGSAGLADGGPGGGTGGGDGAGAEVDLARYPGIGSDEALANPRCDRDRGRIRFPSQFAPQCVAPWPEGADNGGATWQGVTGDSIRIVVYMDPEESSTGPSKEEVRTQVTETLNAFADHYELWGRELDLVFYEFTGQDEASQRADAVRVANEIKPFMATSFLRIGVDPPRVWATELAARGIITWDEFATYDELQSQAGFRWAYAPDDRYTALLVGEYVGKRLAGRPARWAGDARMHGQERVFGLAYDSAWDRGTFERTLGQHGAEVADAVSYRAGTDLAVLQQQATTQVARLKSAGVTNVVLVGGVFYSAAMTRAATQQNYFPEWTITGWNLQDVAVLTRLGPDQRQWGSAFGIGLVPPLESPIEISERNRVFEWAYGRQPSLEAVNGQIYLLAKNIMAGFHLAGPELTPTTFRDGMFGFAPSGGRWCGCVTRNGASFGRHISAYPGDKYFDIDDFAEKWWDPEVTSQDEVGLTSRGGYWVVDNGRRYAPGDFPDSEPDVFNPASAVISFSSPPPNDLPPDYPPPR